MSVQLKFKNNDLLGRRVTAKRDIHYHSQFAKRGWSGTIVDTRVNIRYKKDFKNDVTIVFDRLHTEEYRRFNIQIILDKFPIEKLESAFILHDLD